MSDVFYPDKNSDANKFQAKQRFRRGHFPQPVIIVDLLDRSTMDELMAKRLAAKHEAMMPFVQGMSAQLTPLPQPVPPLLLE